MCTCSMHFYIHNSNSTCSDLQRLNANPETRRKTSMMPEGSTVPTILFQLQVKCSGHSLYTFCFIAWIIILFIYIFKLYFCPSAMHIRDNCAILLFWHTYYKRCAFLPSCNRLLLLRLRGIPCRQLPFLERYDNYAMQIRTITNNQMNTIKSTVQLWITNILLQLITLI